MSVNKSESIVALDKDYRSNIFNTIEGDVRALSDTTISFNPKRLTVFGSEERNWEFSIAFSSMNLHSDMKADIIGGIGKNGQIGVAFPNVNISFPPGLSGDAKKSANLKAQSMVNSIEQGLFEATVIRAMEAGKRVDCQWLTKTLGVTSAQGLREKMKETYQTTRNHQVDIADILAGNISPKQVEAKKEAPKINTSSARKVRTENHQTVSKKEYQINLSKKAKIGVSILGSLTALTAPACTSILPTETPSVKPENLIPTEPKASVQAPRLLSTDISELVSTPTFSTTPDYTATQQVYDNQSTQDALETQTEIFVQETQVAVEATAQAEATKQVEEQIENQKYETFINAVSESFISDGAFISRSPDGDIHLSKKLMENKSLVTGFELPKDVTTSAIRSTKGLMICNASEYSDSDYKNICSNIQRKALTSEYLISVSERAETQRPIEAVITDGNQTIEGAFEKISIWLGTHNDINQYRNIATDSGFTVVDGLSLTENRKSMTDTNTFMFVANKTLYVFGSSLSSVRHRSSDFSAAWPFANVDSSAPDVNMLFSFDTLYADVLGAVAMRFFPESIQKDIISANTNELWPNVACLTAFRTGINDRFCQSGVHFSVGCADLAESIITRKY